MVEIRWLTLAKTDLKEIFYFISKNSIKYANIEVRQIIKQVSILKTFPKIGKIVREIEKEDIRELIKGNYRIVYRIISTNRIDILMIHHSARNLKKRLKY